MRGRGFPPLRSSLFCAFGGLAPLAPRSGPDHSGALGPEVEAEAETEADGAQDDALGMMAATLPEQQGSVSAVYPPSVSVPATFVSGDEVRCEATPNTLALTLALTPALILTLALTLTPTLILTLALTLTPTLILTLALTPTLTLTPTPTPPLTRCDARRRPGRRAPPR